MAEQSNQFLQDLIQKFKDRYQSDPQVITYAPGRIEALGNHTDYNEGFVLSAAIDKGIYFLATPTQDSTVTIFSVDLNETVVWSNISPQSPSLSPSPEKPSWSNYIKVSQCSQTFPNIKGVLAQLVNLSNKNTGFQAIFGGNLPQGAGLSSSAALEVSSALGICKILSIDVPRHDLAKICQKSEHNYVGVKCGLLDQFSSLYGKNNNLVLCDFRSLQVENVAVGRAAFLVVNTNVHHNLVTSEYNERRESCEQATKFFAGKLAGKSVTHLRDVTWDEWKNHSQEIPNEMYAKRAAHVIGENERVLKGKEYLNGQEPLLGFGKLMFESHDSSRNFFENSCPELDQVVNDAKQVKEVYGARLSGGGFGGSAILLVNVDDLEKVMKQLKEKYAGTKFEVSFVLPSDGAVVIKG